jgi:uncharacterized protein (TIGR03546 family)
MFGIEILAKLIRILRSAATPAQIASGFILGMIIGLTPLWSLHNLVIFILIVVLNVNIGMALFSFAIFSAFAYVLDPLFHQFGFFILVDLSNLRALWTTLYNYPIIPLSKFNNTVVMGSLVSSVLLLFPVYLYVKKGVIWYRENIDTRMQKWKIVKLVKGSKIYDIYQKIRRLGD